MNKQPHIMLDIETLDTRESAVVLSVGMVVFHPQDDIVIKWIHMGLDGNEQQAKGRTISVDTVMWWLGQTREAQDGLRTQRVSDTKALRELAYRITEVEPACVWGNGSDFDNNILLSLFRSFDIDPPFSFYQNRCFRTFKAEFGAPDMERPADLVAHNALSDALWQAKQLQAIYKKLGGVLAD
jgi:exodeoxyribonuclease VIII